MSRLSVPVLAAGVLLANACLSADHLFELQTAAIEQKFSPVAHWGPDPQRYSSWTTHTNRLIPVYTYGTAGGGAGIDLESYLGPQSVYRSEAQLRRLYQGPAPDSVDPDAPYMDQTDIYRLQRAALEAGKKHIFLVIFDGMDWETTRAAAIWNLQQVAYGEGRGRGTHFQEYHADGTSQFGWMVTSPRRDGIQVDVNEQRVKNPDGGLAGGYSPVLAGRTPWDKPREPYYLVAGPEGAPLRHAYTDSSSSATSMTAGIKTYNNAVNVDATGQPQATIAHHAQAAGYRVGAVTSVPISHATPAATYAHNVDRDDYQDLTRDMLGLPSISHPDQPLPGMDVVMGGGFGVEKLKDPGQGENFVAGNVYLTDQDLASIDSRRGGRYVVSMRQAGCRGDRLLRQDAERAARAGARFFALYGVGGEHRSASGNLPLASADGDYQPACGVDRAPINYTVGDITENPTLADFTRAAITVLAAGDAPFWLMVEAGDVDWANHANNLDASIGAVNCGDAAVRAITQWVELHSNWEESVMIVTADHGHYLVLDHPELLLEDNNRDN